MRLAQEIVPNECAIDHAASPRVASEEEGIFLEMRCARSHRHKCHKVK